MSRHTKEETKQMFITLTGFLLLCVFLFYSVYHISNSRVRQLHDINYIIHTKDGKEYRVYSYSSPDEGDMYYSFTDESGSIVNVPIWNWNYVESIK